MHRRTLLHTGLAAGTAAVAAVSGAARAVDPKPAAAAKPMAMPPAAPGKYAALVASSGDCLAKGEVCMAHCVKLLGQGDTTIAKCATSVQELLAACTALQKLAAQQSPHTPAMARVALDICTACEKTCREHELHHVQCKDCANACLECSKQCKAVLKT